ncbi:inhibitor of growth protein 2-like [Coccinella septempunctata]|uniref:inhibitor of growth protein 2-like n=1 Tax=Coccinella septempunctata TaxID=41139 RepID=UPI001D0864CB|nr:inhibitor of growth protein 2-like [Coccinella septempunctata]
MINQPSSEALNAATYVENYLDSVENFPNEVQRLVSRIRELHVCFIAKVKEAKHWKKQADENPKQKQKCYLRMQIALSAAQEIGDEKMSVVQTMNDKIELRCRSLNMDLRNLDVTREDQSSNENRDVPLPTSSSSMTNSAPLVERSNKRSRRGGRNDTYTENNQVEPMVETPSKSQIQSVPNSSQRKTNTGKKKKRKSRQNTQTQREDHSSKEEEPIIDPDEPTYCLCDQISYGEMIMCDNDLCPIEWFHFSCVSLTTKPKGKWYCPKCRGDRPNVMKPKAQFLRELEKYNKEKEEKT